MKLRIKLLSDLCVSSGDFSNGVVDTEITVDDFGIPLIPGKRVKGLFREAAEEWLEFFPEDREAADEIFGKAGENCSGAVFGNLYPSDYQKLREFLNIAKYDDRWKRYAGFEQVQNYYTSIRTQTAMDENGIADENTLRSSRVIRKEAGIFEGEVLLADPSNEKQKELLGTWAKMIRHMGMNRTRGCGNIVCQLESERGGEKTGKKLEPQQEKEMGVLSVHLYLEQPCVMEQNYITGTMLRGAFAAEFAKNERVQGNPTENLHQNPLFQQLFLSGNVEYGFCWPYENNRPHIPVPKSFLREKKSEGDGIYDLAGCEPEEIGEFLNQKERCRSGFTYVGAAREGELEVFQSLPERIVTNHHRRPADRSIGHAQKSAENRKSTDGQLYSLEAVKEGQMFYGEIRGNRGLLALLEELLPDGACIFMGASKSSQYGKVRLCYGNGVQKVREDLKGKTVITLTSPMAAEDEYGNSMTDEKRIVKMILGGREIEGTRIISCCGEEMLSGYHGRWRMPLIQRRVLSAGSVFIVYGLELDKTAAEEIESRSYGKYRGEGYGRVAVNLHGSAQSGTYKEEQCKEQVLKVRRYQDYEPKAFVDACLRERITDACKGTECIKRIRKTLKIVPNTNVLSGLRQICRTSESFDSLTNQLKKAAERATKANSEWYQKILDQLLGEEGRNRFHGESLRRIDLRGEWEERWKEILEQEEFCYFKEILEQMIYEVHLEKRNGGNCDE